jgi:hypothetical protein
MDFILFALPMDKGHKRPSRNILGKGMTSLSATFTLPAWMLPAKKLRLVWDFARKRRRHGRNPRKGRNGWTIITNTITMGAETGYSAHRRFFVDMGAVRAY